MHKNVLNIYRKLSVYIFILGLLVSGIFILNTPTSAVAGINQRINFQGRLLNSQGATVADGYYNIEFKIYQDGDGQTAGNSTGLPAGVLKWTESYLNNNSQGVVVKNGFMSVELGSVTPFGTSIDWNQDTLWLSMNIAGTGLTCTPFTSCSPDGEMVPMKRLSSTPYSLNSGLLGGLSSAQFLQIAQGVQTDASTNTSSIFINKTGTGNFVTLQSSGNDAFIISNSGDINFGANANHTIAVMTAAADAAGKSLTISGGNAGTGASALAGGNLVLQGGAAGGTDGNGGNLNIDAGVKNGVGNDGSINIGTSYARTIQIGNTTLATGIQTINIGNANTAGGQTDVTIGNGSSATSGTTTIQAKSNVMISTNGTLRATFDTTNSLYLGNGTTAAAPSDFTIKATSSSTTGVAGGKITVQGGNATVGNANGGDLEFQGGNAIGTNNNGGTIAINAGILSGTGSDGNINIGNVHARTIQIGNSTIASGVQDINIGTGNTAGGTTNVVIGSGSSATGGTTTVRSKSDLTVTTSSGNMSLSAPSGTMTISSSGNSSLTSTAGTIGLVSSGNTTITTNGLVRSTFDTANNLYLGNGTTGALNPFVVSSTNGSAGVAGSALTIKGGIGGSSSAGGALNLQGGAGGSTSGAGGSVAVQGGNATAGNSNGGDLSLNAGTKFGAGVDGNINIGNLNTNTIQIGNTAPTATQTINIGGSTTAGTTNVTIGSSNSSTAGTTAIQAKGNITISTAGVARGTFDSATGNLYLGNGVTAAAPNNFTISGTGSTTTAVTGGALTIQGGNATVGSANGGNLTISGGTGIGTGVNGIVVMTTPTFATTSNDANCYTGGALVAASCTIAASSINNSSAVIVGFNTAAQTSILPDPTINVAGRVIYVTAANGSNDFTLSVNGGGTGNTIAMRQNTTATMIWNGTDWTAAGASSSTTLQSAYDNTLQSAGGAELIVSHTGNTNGLTIRDSSTAPVNGTLLSVQTSSAAGLFSVNSNVTEYSSDSGAEVAGGTSSTFPASTWSAVTGSTVSRYTTVGDYIATGQASVSVATSTSANSGVKNTLLSSLTAGTNYNVSFTSRLSTGTFTDMQVYYSIDGTAASTLCTSNKAVVTSVWTKVNCSFAAPTSGITATNAIIIRQVGSGTARTFYVDNLSVTISADYNYATDGSVNDAVNFATNWSFVNATSGAGSTSRNTADGYDASDSATATITTGAANAGIRNKLSINPLVNTLYRISVYAKLSTGTFTDFKIRYSPIGSTGSAGTYVDCVDYNTQTITTTGWTKISCYVRTGATTVTTPYVYFVESTATVRTYHVDNLSMTLADESVPNVQIGGGVNGGPVTLFTLDRGSSAPIASDNDALLGSMYYDTTLGKLQCYEADGWGACGSSPDNVVTISPEFTNAVMHGTGIGTMTSDLCSDTLNINDGSSSQPTICGANETYNFYKWTSPQASAQTYSIYVTYQLPSTFKEFASGQTSLMGRTDNANSTVQYQIYKNDSATGLSSCGSAITVSTGVQTAWQTVTATGAADPSTCNFAAGNSIVFKISTTASQNASAYVGNLNFIFSNR